MPMQTHGHHAGRLRRRAARLQIGDTLGGPGQSHLGDCQDLIVLEIPVADSERWWMGWWPSQTIESNSYRIFTRLKSFC